MRSGNGRHRRPRQAPAIVVAAGVTGSAIAMPLLAATGAHAADAPTWDRVAQCESGGMWSANSGNGSYGGLQLTQELWEQNGGRVYAPRPDLASRSQQIAVAEKILNGSGPSAWQNCGAAAGLGKGGRAPDVNPGSTKDPSRPESPAPRAPEHSPSPSTDRPESPAPSKPSEPTKPSESPKPSEPSKPSTPSSSPSPSAPAPSGTPSGSGEPGKGDGSPSRTPSGSPSAPASGRPDAGPGGAPTDDPTAIPTAPVNPPTGTPGTTPGPADSRTPGAPAGEGTGKHRADPPRSDDEQRPSRGGDEARPGVPAAGDYTVRPGDNLSAIAEKHSVTGGWHSLYERNEKVVGKDPDLILPGQRLEMGK
ncbi:transglycosylase family protein [Streptomyces sp. HU2014]|uniref:LysM peptidoglycan-binding domain-containing protein n=1 Tax=Streptomyces sp. HU2014 TaxID=2939414 RepID=UPI00200FEA5F|nr:transglycosylase family protein [Streptomyces sp. HU2014]UQI43337.1 transglycosylase family protein [Streptomyces sp. HU2014]